MLNPSIKRNLTGIGIVAEGHHTVGAVYDRPISIDKNQLGIRIVRGHRPRLQCGCAARHLFRDPLQFRQHSPAKGD